MTATVVRVEPLSESSEAPSNPIAFTDLTDPEREIVTTAVEEGEYRRCPGEETATPDPVSTFAERVRQHLTADDRAYLRYDGRYYAVGLVVGDERVSFLPTSEE